MKFSKFLFASAAVCFLLSAAPSRAEDRKSLSLSSSLLPDSSIVSGTLENGMSWRVIRNSEPANRIFLRLVVKAGSALEDDDQKGVAHLIEHMAFNGTELFEKNELVDYFESIGMTFGPEVNAYTGFDETVYMLEIPADDSAALDKALLVLHDWASAITFDPGELEKERGVVVEEWRLGRGASGRIQDKQVPFIFKGSRYAERLPIGDPEIVRTVSTERVRAFYKTWYRTDLMSVVLVGDADPEVLSSAIARSLGAVPASDKRVKRPEFAGPNQAKPDALIIRDPELAYTSLQMLEQTKMPSLKTVGDFRRRVAENIAVSIFNNRLEEKTLQADPQLLGAQLGLMRIIKPTRFNYLGIVPVTGRFTGAFRQAMEELLRLEAHGVTDGELAREKQSVLDAIEQAWLEREKIHSASRAVAVVQSILYGDPVLSIDARHDLYKALVPGITAKEIDGIIDSWFTGRGKLLVVSAPDSAEDIPSREELLALWQEWKPALPITPYSESGLDRPLFTSLPERDASLSGAITAERALSANGIKEWTLSNGARVIAYHTDNKANEILFSAFSAGGTSLVSDKEYPSASMASTYAQMSGMNGFSSVELQKKLAGKTVSVEAWIDDSYEGLSGSSSVSDLETLFQLVNLKFTRQTFSPEAWTSLVAQLDTLVKSRETSPDEMFSDLKVRLLYGDSVRHANMSRQLVAAMGEKQSEAVYQGRFSDASDFTFVFVGSFDEAALREFSEEYLAVLPSSQSREKALDDGIAFPSGIKGDTLRMGIDPQSSVFLAFGGKPSIGKYEYELFNQLLSLLDIRFREVIREDMSGSYGVTVNGSVSAYPVPKWSLNIDFGCEPGREDALTAAILEQIKLLASAPVPDVYISKLRESIRRNQETGLKNNRFWIARIVQELLRGRSLDGISDTESIVSAVNPESMRDMVKKYLPADNYVKAVLVPAEKK